MQNEALHVYFQDSQVQLIKEKEKDLKRQTLLTVLAQNNLIQILRPVHQMKAHQESVDPYTMSTALQTNNSEKWLHKGKHTQKHKKKHKKTIRTP